MVDRKVTLEDVARISGVHSSTVSRALNPAKAALVNVQTRRKVQQAAASLGYRPDPLAIGLRSGRTSTLGVVVADLTNPFVAPVIRGIENSLESRDLMALVSESQDDSDRFRRIVDHLLHRRVDAIITTAARQADEPMLRKVSRTLPVILAVRTIAGSGLPYVTIDDRLGGRLAAEHLADVGCKRVVEVAGPADVSSFALRSAGFREAAALHGIEVLDFFETATTPTFAEGVRVTRSMVGRWDAPPEAIFAHNDLMAVGVIQVLKSHGLDCPDDVLVIGYNDTPNSAYMNPPLTTIRSPSYEMGRVAADMAVMLIEETDREPPALTLPPVLIPRTSTLGAAGSD